MFQAQGGWLANHAQVVPLEWVPLYSVDSYVNWYWMQQHNTMEWHLFMVEMMSAGNVIARLMLQVLAPTLSGAHMGMLITCFSSSPIYCLCVPGLFDLYSCSRTSWTTHHTTWMVQHHSTPLVQCMHAYSRSLGWWATLMATALMLQGPTKTALSGQSCLHSPSTKAFFASLTIL